MRTCAIRSAYSLNWDQSLLKGGTYDYLCPFDLETLKEEISQRAQMCKALDVVEILDEAQKLKVSRNQKAIDFLKLINSDKLASTNDIQID